MFCMRQKWHVHSSSKRKIVVTSNASLLYLPCKLDTDGGYNIAWKKGYNIGRIEILPSVVMLDGCIIVKVKLVVCMFF